MDNNTKRCKKCQLTKKLDEFHKSKTTKDGRRAPCKKCKNIYQNIYRSKLRKLQIT